MRGNRYIKIRSIAHDCGPGLVGRKGPKSLGKYMTRYVIGGTVDRGDVLVNVCRAKSINTGGGGSVCKRDKQFPKFPWRFQERRSLP